MRGGCWIGGEGLVLMEGDLVFCVGVVADVV